MLKLFNTHKLILRGWGRRALTDFPWDEQVSLLAWHIIKNILQDTETETQTFCARVEEKHSWKNTPCSAVWMQLAWICFPLGSGSYILRQPKIHSALNIYWAVLSKYKPCKKHRTGILSCQMERKTNSTLIIPFYVTNIFGYYFEKNNKCCIANPHAKHERGRIQKEWFE